MKKSLKHLPQNKQEELEKVVVAIQKSCKDVEKIILFGSYARGDYKEKKDLKPEQKTGHISDYDILVVTEKKSSINKFTSWAGEEKLKLSAPARIIAQDIQSLNIKLSEGQYLFSDIKKEGILLFDAKRYKLVNKRALKPEEREKIAKAYFEHWFNKAKDFLDTFDLMLKKNKNASAAFHLHQVAEACYKTILLVITNYNPKEHYLGILKQMTQKYHPDLKTIFPKKFQKQKDRFNLLDYAYIGGRYDETYKISENDLEILAKDVKKLLELTEEICKEGIQKLRLL